MGPLPPKDLRCMDVLSIYFDEVPAKLQILEVTKLDIRIVIKFARVLLLPVLVTLKAQLLFL